MIEISHYPGSVWTYGAKAPVAWDGGSQHLYQSVTNNARYYGVHTIDQATPEFINDFGFTDTTTSNAAYTFNSNFIYPGISVISLYADADTNKYNIGVIQVSGTTITELSRTPYPSQSFTNTGFIRSWVVYPDNPTILLYGGGATPGVTAYQATVGSSGTIGGITSLGAVTYPDPGAFPGGGTKYLANISPPRVISDRLAYQDNTKALFDRLNPNHIIDAYTMTASVTPYAYPAGDFYFSSARVAPNHLGIVGRNSANTSRKVVDALVAADGSSMTVNATWTPPAGNAVTVAGWTSLGKAVAYTQDASFNITAYYDIFGTPTEFLPPVELTNIQNHYVVPTSPSGSESWIVGHSNSTTGPIVLEQVPTRSIGGEPGPAQATFIPART